MRNPHNEPLSDPDILETDDTGAERRCILSGERAPRDALIRLALGPDGSVAPDVLARAPGRGAWIGVTRDELATAIEKGKLKSALARAFKGEANAPPADLPDRITAALQRVLLDRLGLEARAGKLLTGFDRIDTAARRGQVALLLHAADAGEDGAGKLAQAHRVGARDENGDWIDGPPPNALTLIVDRDALSMALGRANVVHLALVDKAAAARVGDLARRLLAFLGHDDDGRVRSAGGKAPRDPPG